MEASEYRQSINLIDHFSAGWTEEALQTAWVLQRIQVGVPAGCTSLVQVTDVGLAAQAKAALNRWKELARDRMREKARQENTVCKYEVDAVEIIQAALSMHAQMVEQNNVEQTVLRTGRQAGWLHFRPDLRNKALFPARRQAWAKIFPEGSDRVGADFLRLRDAWYAEGQILPFSDKDLQDPNLAAGFQTEAQYLINEIDKTYNGLDIEMTGAFAIDETEKALFDSVFQHPSLRAIDDPDWQKRIQDTATQLPKRKSDPMKHASKKRRKRSVKELAIEWQKDAGSKTAAAVLKSIVPTGANGKSGKSGKSGKKKKNKKKKGKSVKKKAKKHKKKASKLQALADLQKTKHPLVGKAVRIIDSDVPAVFQGALAVVHSSSPDGNITVQLHDNTFYKLPSVSSVTTDLTQKLPLTSSNFDKNNCLWTEEQKARILAMLNGQVPQPAATGQLLEDPELIVSLVLEVCRVDKTIATHAKQRVKIWLPAQACSAADFLIDEQLESENTKAATKELKDALLSDPPDEKWMLVCPVHCFHPLHWTVLLVFFEPQSTTISQVKYFDSLTNEPEESKQKAQAMLHVIQTAASQSTTDLPPRCNTIRQKDGWSCGYHSILFVVENVKSLVHIFQPVRKIKMMIEQINQFQKSLQPASDVPSEPPPLPPPTKPPAPPPLAKPITAKPISQISQFGCSRCRLSEGGCLSCNPVSTIRYHEKKAAKAALKDAEPEADLKNEGVAKATVKEATPKADRKKSGVAKATVKEEKPKASKKKEGSATKK